LNCSGHDKGLKESAFAIAKTVASFTQVTAMWFTLDSHIAVVGQVGKLPTNYITGGLAMLTFLSKNSLPFWVETCLHTGPLSATAGAPERSSHMAPVLPAKMR